MARITDTLSQLDLGCPSTLPNTLFHWSFLWTGANRDMRETRSIQCIVLCKWKVCSYEIL